MPAASAAAQSVLQAYAALWQEPDAARRAELIERSLQPDARILGPGFTLAGWQQVDGEVVRWLQQEPGLRAVASSGFDQHHDVVRFSIAIVEADGTVAIEGIDVVEFGDDGRICRVLTFWGPPPPVPADWPVELTMSGR